MPGAYDLALYRGDTEARTIELYADADFAVPYDLDGATVAAQIRDRPCGSPVVDLGVVVILPNTITITMAPDNYATCPSSGVWDLEITDADGTVHTELAGTVKVTPDVTSSR